MSSEMRELVHDAICRALDEAGIKNETLRGMCLEVGLEKFYDGVSELPEKASPAFYCPECDAQLLYECVTCSCSNYPERSALLARTEAGADGVVDSRAAFERWAKPQGYRLHIRDTPGSARLGQYGDDSTQAAWEAWTASRTTRPQDASGDVVLTGPGDHDDLPAFLEWVASEVVRRDTRAGNFAEGLAQSLCGRAHILRIVKNDAMQAKEAK